MVTGSGMKILLFGGSGQLGYSLKMQAQDLNFELVAPVSSEVDISSLEQVLFLTKQLKPDLVVNCAAHTAIDKAEVQQEVCWRINHRGAANVAQAVSLVGGRMIHISTEQVFPGTGTTPLREGDPTGPLNVYGQSKLAGEQDVLQILADRALIVRTSALHGQRGVNFVSTMLKLFADKDEVRVVNDQKVSPTWAGWLAEVILDLGRTGTSGVVHACCEGVTSWYDFACAIRDCSSLASSAPIKPVSSAEFGRPARRPSFSAFDCARLTSLLGRRPISWQEGLKRHLTEVGALKAGAGLKGKEL